MTQFQSCPTFKVALLPPNQVQDMDKILSKIFYRESILRSFNRFSWDTLGSSRLVLPIVIRQTVNVMNAGANFTDTTDLGTFGFLYGTIPAAPGVFVIASQYNTEVDLIASSMVACTFISAPLMVISAKMITLTNLNPTKYLSELVLVAFDISVTSIIACFWLLLLFSVTRKIRRMPHKITSCLVLSQVRGSRCICRK